MLARIEGHAAHTARLVGIRMCLKPWRIAPEEHFEDRTGVRPLFDVQPTFDPDQIGPKLAGPSVERKRGKDGTTSGDSRTGRVLRSAGKVTVYAPPRPCARRRAPRPDAAARARHRSGPGRSAVAAGRRAPAMPKWCIDRSRSCRASWSQHDACIETGGLGVAESRDRYEMQNE